MSSLSIKRRILKLEEMAKGPCSPDWLLAERRFYWAFLSHALPPGETEESRRAFLNETESLPFDRRLCARTRWLLGRRVHPRNRQRSSNAKSEGTWL